MLELLGTDTVRKRVAKFTLDATDSMATMDKAAQVGDFDTVQAAAHKLSGSCALFGATALHAQMRQIEIACKENRDHDAQQGVAAILESGVAGVASLEGAVDRLTQT